MRWALLDVCFFFYLWGFRVFNARPRNTGGPRAIPGGEGTGGPGDTLAGEPTAEGPDRRAFPAKSVESQTVPYSSTDDPYEQSGMAIF